MSSLGEVPPSPPPSPDAARAADQLTSLHGLLDKVITAGTLCRHARHQELAGRAATLAEALYTEDSLVVASVRMYEASALWNMSCAANEAGSYAEEEALDSRNWALLLPLHALLLRRVAANTLLSGTVRQEESEYGAYVDTVGRRAASKPALSNVDLQAAGQWIGYKTLLEVVINTVKLLGSRRWPRAQKASAQAFVLDALDVIPRTAGVLEKIAYEESLAHVVEVGGRSLDPAFRDALLRKWRSPAVSNVLRARGTLQTAVAGHEQIKAEFEARQRADIEKIGLRECAWPSCDKVERTVREFKQCSGCRSVWYCGPEHQMLDWGEHRKICGELDAARRKAATADAARQAAAAGQRAANN